MSDEETCDKCDELLDECVCDPWCGTCEQPLDDLEAPAIHWRPRSTAFLNVGLLVGGR